MKTKTFYFIAPFEFKNVDKAVNAYLTKHKILFKSAQIDYTIGESDLFVSIQHA